MGCPPFSRRAACPWLLASAGGSKLLSRLAPSHLALKGASPRSMCRGRVVGRGGGGRRRPPARGGGGFLGVPKQGGGGGGWGPTPPPITPSPQPSPQPGRGSAPRLRLAYARGGDRLCSSCRTQR